MKRFLAVLCSFCALATLPSAQAQVAAADLAHPPANAERWEIVSTAGHYGTSLRWTTQDGVRWSRESINLRGFVTEIDEQQTLAPNGTVRALTIRGVTPNGDAGETFSANGDHYSYRSPVDHGDASGASGALYASVGGTLDGTIAFFDALRSAPNHTLALLPTGRAQLIALTTRQVTNGHETKTLTAYAVNGLSFAPSVVWYDGDRFFANAYGSELTSYVPSGWENVVQDLQSAEDAAIAERSRALVDQIGPRLTHPVMFQDVRIYDSLARRFREHQSVVVNDGRIVAVGNAASVHAPAGAQIVPGAARTLLPGLWDSHQHYVGDEEGPLLLSQGITSIRDPGNRPEVSTARRHRIERGEALGPRIVPSLMIDGVSEYTAQIAVVVHNEQEAIAAVDRAKNEGYFAIKLYGSVNPAWVAPMAAEAHRLGLHVHGHIPAGMRPLDAVHAGYDEITHINFVMMQAMPQDVVDHSNGIARHMGTAQYAPDVDLHGSVMRPFLDELQRRHIAVDPTLVTFEQEFVPDSGDVTGAYGPFLGTLPTQVERSFLSGGLPSTPQVSRARMRQAQAALQALVGELYRRRITIVAGTDISGLELVRELELYVAAGMTPADALATATIAPSRLFGVGAVAGSISVGKNAELFLVDGDPSRNIGDLRNVELVMRDGRLMRASDLRSSIGISGPPHAMPAH